MARTKLSPQPKLPLNYPSTGKRVPNPQPRDRSPVRTPDRIPTTLVIITAGDHACSMQVRLKSSIIPLEVEAAITGESIIHIEDHILRESVLLTSSERMAIARFLKSIGFISESVPYKNDVTVYDEIATEVKKQGETRTTELNAQTRHQVDRIWNFLSESRAVGAVSKHELTCIGEYLTSTECNPDDAALFVKEYGSKLPGIEKVVNRSKQSAPHVVTTVVVNSKEQSNSDIEFNDATMRALGEHLCFDMDPVKKAEWIKRWAKHGIDLSKE